MAFKEAFARAMIRALADMIRSTSVQTRRRLRESEAAFIPLAALVGLGAGVMTNLQGVVAHTIQQLIYGVTINRLSALGSIHHPWKLLALPLGGLGLSFLGLLLRRRTREPIDVVEANALHGGRIPIVDNLIIAGQTILSNGVGASVGLEATYAQMGGGIASALGQALRLRRSDLRTLVGAGAGAAVGAAFGAPLTGAFYAFEIVIGTYTPAAVAPVVVAALAASLVTRTLGVTPYLIATTSDRLLGLQDYLVYALLGLACGLCGILVMRLVAWTELLVQRLGPLRRWSIAIGGALLVPIAWLSPQALSAGHGALHLDLVLHLSIDAVATIILLKVLASVISLGFGFRGGLFFASLFLGSLLGQLVAELLAMSPLHLALDWKDAAMVGMAALTVSIIGGPMTLSLLVLETTHDFALMGVVLAASLVASTFTREAFGYSFSTWRLHLRGASIRSPRDIGWIRLVTAGRLMRTDFLTMRDSDTVADFRLKVPLGAASKVILVDAKGHYRGVVPTAVAYAPDLDPMTPLAEVATLKEINLSASSDIQQILHVFNKVSADDLAVVDAAGQVVGVVSEKYVQRRFYAESEAALRAVYGER